MELDLQLPDGGLDLRSGSTMMQVPLWAKNEQDNFWQRHYELATLTEQACEQAIEQQLQTWLRELEQTDGPAAQDQP